MSLFLIRKDSEITGTHLPQLLRILVYKERKGKDAGEQKVWGGWVCDCRLHA